MKKLLLILLCLLTLCACNKKDSGTMVIEEGEEPEWLAGGWYVNPDLPTLNDAYFNEATNEYTPILMLGTQVVAGTNYMYLAYNAIPQVDAQNSYKIVKVYVDLDNKAELLSASDFVVTNYTEENSENEEIVGGFTVNSEQPNLLDDSVNVVFNKALEGLVGVGYEPICLLASQVVAGTNYAFLAKGTAVTAQPQTNLYVITVYESLDGAVDLNNISLVDLASFN